MASLVYNKKALFDYEVLEKYEAGIELLGFEVKSLRGNRGSLEGAYVIVRGMEVYLVGATIPPYQQGNTPTDYDPQRARRLLLQKEEIRKLSGRGDMKGLTLIPISMYNKGRVIKVEIALSRGKKKYDKRESIKKRETGREIRREMKGH